MCARGTDGARRLLRDGNTRAVDAERLAYCAPGCGMLEYGGRRSMGSNYGADYIDL